MKLNRKQLRKMILQELFLLSEPREVSKFNPDDQEFASALKYVAARDYPESGITVDLSDSGVMISSGAGAFPTVKLKTSGAEFNPSGYSRGGTVFISGPGGLSGNFSDRHFEYGGLDKTAFQVAAEEILGRLSVGNISALQREGIPRQPSRYNLYENDIYLGNPVANKVQDGLNQMGYRYKVKEVPYMSGGVNPFDEFDSTVIGTLEKAGMYDENVYYVDTGKDFKAVDEIQGFIDDVAGFTFHSSSGGFLGRTVFFRG